MLTTTTTTTITTLAAHAQVFEAAGLTPLEAPLLSSDALVLAIKAPALRAAALGLFEGMRALAEHRHSTLFGQQPSLPETLNASDLLVIYPVVYCAPGFFFEGPMVFGTAEQRQALSEASVALMCTFDALRSAILLLASTTTTSDNDNDSDNDYARLVPWALTQEFVPQLHAMLHALDAWKGPRGEYLLQHLRTILAAARHARGLLASGIAWGTTVTVGDMDVTITSLRNALEFAEAHRPQ
jgi:hypothetical protein